MTQKNVTAELLAMRKRAERTAQNIDRLKNSLGSARQELRRVINAYSAKRIKLFQEELCARGLTWCTLCAEETILWKPQVVPEHDTELILLEGRKIVSGGYENSCYGFEDFFGLHRACPKCREKALDRHGTRGSYNTMAKDQTIFYAFRVEKREDGYYYARKFGNWVKLDDEKCKLSEPPSQLVEQLAGEWNLPPRIEFDHSAYNDDKLVIHERVATAEAV